MEITGEQFLPNITDLLGKEFVCYDCRNVCKNLQILGYIVNRKKVFRIMKEINLFNYRGDYPSLVRRVMEFIVSANRTNVVWKMDVK